MSAKFPRGGGGGGAGPFFSSKSTMHPEDWQTFLTNDENKLQLTRLVLYIWRDNEVADKYKYRKVILIAEGHAYSFRSDEQLQHTLVQELASLYSNQKKTDSVIVWYSKMC